MRRRFREAAAAFDAAKPVWVLGHNDADGLSATAILARALQRAGRKVRTRVVGRGESPWSSAMREELAGKDMGGLVIADLGVRATSPRPETPLVVLDHHVPQDSPPGAVVISGDAMTPSPTTSLLAYWSAQGLGPADDLLWLAALGLIGDMAEGEGFAEMDQARRYGVTALRKATSLVNAPRRTASGDASAALRLLMREDGPKPLVAGETPDAAALQAAKAEVKAEGDAAKRIAPVVSNGVALIAFASPCQIHPLVAQQWRGRLKNEIVMAANHGYRPGWTHFAVRTARDLDLVAFLAKHRPPGAGDEYGSGHRQATGGALRAPDWNRFIRSLGFGPEQEVPE
ncbi:MAG: DHH family phosphoesterase [Caulobacteraceae bacterium]|nr:DHH family phosphoesterase [Caulobacter sp.]